MFRMATYLRIFCISATLCLVTASIGDRSLVYQNCLRPCNYVNCTSSQTTNTFPLLLLEWDCFSECKYQCMWYAVDAFQRDGTPVPQFHGKWPFVRLWGMQEPVSVLFSFTNLLAVLAGMWRFRRAADRDAPMYNVWLVNGVTCLNAWFWSMVFHTRDTPLTEKMDYFCALSLVLSSLFVLIIRSITSRRPYLLAAIGVLLASFFTQHVYYLAFVRFDYQYNMMVNVTSGVLNSLGWLIFSVRRRKRHYVHKCVLCVITIMSLLSLELQDFTPFLWAVDAHALWHAGTSPLPVIWFSFAADDCNFIHQKLQNKSQTTTTTTTTTGHLPSSGQQNKVNKSGDANQNGHSKID